MMNYEQCPTCGNHLPDANLCKASHKPPELEKCGCGSEVSIWSTYCTSQGHGYTVNCSTCYPGMGPWAKTRKGAERLWNKQREKETQ